MLVISRMTHHYICYVSISEDSICDDMSAVELEEANKGMAILSPTSAPPPPAAPEPKKLTAFTLDGVVKYIKDNNCKNIVTMVGAGISTCKSFKINHDFHRIYITLVYFIL